MELTLNCNKDGKDNDPVKFEGDFSEVEHKLTAKATHRLLCPKFSISQFLENYKYQFTILYAIVGLICAFAGQKLFKIVLFLLTSIVVCSLIFTILNQKWLANSTATSNANLIIALCISAIAGITIGTLLTVFHAWCFCVIGGILGGMLGFIVFSTFAAFICPAVISFVICSG